MDYFYRINMVFFLYINDINLLLLRKGGTFLLNNLNFFTYFQIVGMAY